MALAQQLKVEEVGSDHLLFGVAKQRGPGAEALKKSGITSDDVRKAVEGLASAEPEGVVGRMFKPRGGGIDLPLGEEALAVLHAAGFQAPDDTITTLDIAAAIAGDQRCAGQAVISALGKDAGALEEELRNRPEDEKKDLVGAGKAVRGPSKKKSVLAECSVDLTAMAREGKLDPCVGRDEEVGRMLRILVRRRKCNPCLVGDPGVGKTALAEGLAQMIVDKKVPPRLQGKRLLSLQVGMLVADTKYRGEFEERLKQVIEEVIADPRIILFIDELHTLMGAGAAGEDSGMDAAQLLKPALARGEMQCVGATTVEEYRRYIEKDAALERRFQPVAVWEPSPEVAYQILTALRPKYEEHHGVTLSDDALIAAVKYSMRYINDRFLPDKAIDLVDEAAAMAQLASGGSVGEEDVAEVVSEWTGVPVKKLSQGDADLLLDLESTIHARVIGQNEAVRAVSRAVRRARAGLSSGTRPVASLLFSGPTGVGKTELVKALAESYYGSEDAMVRIDMSEYMEPQSVSRLVGPPPGYIGYEAGGQLTEAVRRRPFTLVLLDEMEKAHPDVFNLLLQVLEDGRLTDNKGRTVDFSNAMLVMTSNIGGKAIIDSIDEAEEAAAGAAGGEGLGGEEMSEEAYLDMQGAVRAELQEQYRPEFLNRLDEIIVFRPLTRAEVGSIADLMVASVGALCMEKNVSISVTPAWKARAMQDGFSVRFGARPMRRAVQRLLEDAVAESMLEGIAGDGGKLEVDINADGDIVVTGAGGVKRLIETDVFSGGIEGMQGAGARGSDGPAVASETPAPSAARQ